MSALVLILPEMRPAVLLRLGSFTGKCLSFNYAYGKRLSDVFKFQTTII